MRTDANISTATPISVSVPEDISSGRHWFWDCATGISFALLVSTPSIKLFFSHFALNILFLAMVCCLVSFQRRFWPSRENRLSLSLWGIFSTILVMNLLIGINFLSTFTVVRTFYFILSVGMALLAFTPGMARWLTLSLLVWGSFIAFYQFFFGINYDTSLGQHYLTVSLPIGLALTGTIVALLVGRLRTLPLVLLLGLAVLHLMALSTLLSRSALIYPVVATIGVFAISMFSARAPANIWRQGTRVFFLILLLIPFAGTIEFRQLQRVEALSNYDEELRWSIFVQASEYIAQQPVFGYGVNASIDFIGTYSHNIFLEVAMTGGIILLLVFVAILLVYFTKVRVILSNSNPGLFSLMLVGMSMFAFLQWNTSFDLFTAYVPLVLVASVGALDVRKMRISCAVENRITVQNRVEE